MIGDDDGMGFIEDTREKKSSSNSNRWILPNVSHGAQEGETKNEFIIIAKVFFNKKK